MALDFAEEAPNIEPSDGKLSLRRKKKINAADRLFLIEQLALMLENGLSLHEALNSLVPQIDKPALKELVTSLADQIEAGKSFSYAISLHPDAFDSTWVSLIESSENGGFMHEVLEQLTRMEEKQMALRAHLSSAMSYPAFLVFFSIAVVIFVLAVVFPKFGSMFASIEDQLPPTTMVLMWASHVLVDYWMYLIAATAVLSWGVSLWLKSPSGTAIIDHWKLRIPGVRQIMIELYLVQTFRVLGLSLANGVSVPNALASCRDVVKNVRYRKFITDVESLIQEGGGIALGFERADFIPPLVRQMVNTGEKTGNLAGVLTRTAEYYERELAKRLDRVAKLTEPVMLLVMGVIVGGLVSSLILPIFKLSRAVS